jgi:hypothetical protein
MSLRSVVIEGVPLANAGEIRYFVTDAPTAGHARREKMIEVCATHYGGELADATVYQPLGGRSFESLQQLLGVGSQQVHIHPLRSSS